MKVEKEFSFEGKPLTSVEIYILEAWGNFAYHSQSEPSSQKELGHDPLGEGVTFL